MLDPLSKQLIQRGKAVVRLGTYSGKVPSYSSLKACKGTLFFLPMPLLKTIEDVENNADIASVGLPDPEVYIIVSGKPLKQKIIIVHTLVHFDWEGQLLCRHAPL